MMCNSGAVKNVL